MAKIVHTDEGATPDIGVKLTIHIKSSEDGQPRKQVLENVTSIMEIPDEENEVIKGISFYAGTWRDFDFTHIDEVTIKKS